MAYLDPYGANTEPRGWARPEEPHGHERPGAPAGRHWPDNQRPDNGDDGQYRARQADAAPETHVEDPGHDPAPPHRNGRPPRRGRGYPDQGEHAPRRRRRHAGPVEPDTGGHGYAPEPDGYLPESAGYAPKPDGYGPPPGGQQAGPGRPYPDMEDTYAGPGRPFRDSREPYGRSDEPYGGPSRPFDEHPDRPNQPVPYPEEGVGRDETAAMDAPTNPVGWPLVDGAPASPASPSPSASPARPTPPAVDDDPPPPKRRGPGRRRASRSRPATQPASTGRAGRNLPAAIGVGVGLGALVVVPLFLFRQAFVVVVAAAVVVGIWEMVRAVRTSGAQPPLVPLTAGGVLMIGLAWWAGPDALSMGLLITVLAAMVWRLGDGPANFQRDLTAIALIAVYVPFLAGFAVLLTLPSDGHLRVVVTLAAVVLSDTGGYAAGVAFGKHPMAPSVSPKKSWEGLGGSMLAAGLGSALLLWLLLDVEPWWGVVFGLAVSAAAVLGDLGESMIKRDLGIKDMSNLLPGHGGLMDRLDSILFAVPTAYLLLAIFAGAS